MPTYIIDHKKYNTIPKYMMLWRGYEKLSAQESVEKYGYAIRLKNTASVVYECYLPDPDYDNCCVYVDSVTVDDILYRLSHHRDFRLFLERLGVSYPNLKNEYDIDGLLKAIWEYFDIVEFFELGEVDAIDKDDVIDEITRSLENKMGKTSNSSNGIPSNIELGNVQVLTWFDKMLRNRGLKEKPLFLWQLKITDEEYCALKEELKSKLLTEEEEYNYNREVALYIAEFHRREYGYKDNTVDDSRPSTVVFENLGFSEYKTPNYKSLRSRFDSAMKSGAKRLNLHLYRSPENNKTYYLYSLFYNGGLPLRKVVSEDISIAWHRLIRKMLESDERIEFNDEFSDLVKGVVANDSDSLKSFCQQLQNALLMEDYKLLPFCCDSENDLIYQFFLNQGKSVISEIKSKNPFQIQWGFDVNRHRKVIKPRYLVSGPDSIPLKAEFVEDNGLIDKEAFSIITAEDGVEINNINYHRTNCDFYSEESFSIGVPYKDVANITIRCPELDKVLVSEELDVYSPQLIRENEDGEYQLCSNRFIGHKEVIVIVPVGWTIENEDQYNVEEDYTYLDEKAKIIILPSGIEGQQVVLRDGTGTKKVISATIPLTKVVVMNASMVTCLRQSAYFNVKNLSYFLKKSDGSLLHIHRDKLVFCSDRRTGIWTEEPSLGYVYVKPQGDGIYADPIKILNLGEDKNSFSITYCDSDSDNCTIVASWNDGEMRCDSGKPMDYNRWRLKKADCEDSRYVVFECHPSNGSKSFPLTVKTKFSDFQIFDYKGERVENNSYISLVQLPLYKYNIQDVSLTITIQVDDESKYECKTKGGAHNNRITLSVKDCDNRREEERTILAESSLDNLLGGMSNIMKLLYSSQKDVRGATVYLTVSYNDTKISCMIRKYPYRFIKQGLNKIIICKKNDNEDSTNEIVSYEGVIKALPLYNYEGILPIEIEPSPNGEIILSEEVCSWENVLLISGKSEDVLPHAVNTTVDGELSEGEKKEYFRQVFIPMRYEEYPYALMWSDTWKRCCYWYETSLREHIPAGSLFDLKVIMQDAKLLCRFVFNMLLKGLKSGNFTEYKEKLKRNLLDWSKSNHFLWVWIRKDDYSVMAFMPCICKNLYCYEEFLQGWYFAKMDIENMKSLLETKKTSEVQLHKFIIIDFLSDEYTQFMDDLRVSSLDEFIVGNTLGVDANDLLNNKDCQNFDKEEIRDAASDRLIHLSEEDEKEFEPYTVYNEAPNFTHFCERTNMFIRQMRGDKNTNIFSKKPVVRRSVLYYTSTFIDPFIKVWLSGQEIE